MRPARVIAVHRGAFLVDDGAGERRAHISGRLRFQSNDESTLPAVGDWVAVTGAPNDGSTLVVDWVAPRRSVLMRNAPGRAARAQVLAANIDIVLLAAALPDHVNLRRLERAVALAWESGGVPVIVLTKADLCNDVEGALAAVRARLTGIDVLALSTYTGVGLDACTRCPRPAQTAVLLGPSGTGKSTLLNALTGDTAMRTAIVRSDGKGRHTTTHRQLFRLPNGALLIDTPGLRQLQLWGDEASVDATFDDVIALAGLCRFADCSHESEPECAVRAAVDQGTLAVERLAHWRQLRAELAYLARREDARTRADWKRQAAVAGRAVRARLRSKYR
jgi:ribosome biogenesis GTPase